MGACSTVGMEPVAQTQDASIEKNILLTLGEFRIFM